MVSASILNEPLVRPTKKTLLSAKSQSTAFSRCAVGQSCLYVSVSRTPPQSLPTCGLAKQRSSSRMKRRVRSMAGIQSKKKTLTCNSTGDPELSDSPTRSIGRSAFKDGANGFLA